MTGDISSDEIRHKWIECLAVVWRAADWGTITGGTRRSTDVFQHRLRVASKQQSVPQAIRKLCHGLSLQAPEMPTSALDVLMTHEDEAIQMLRDEDVYLTLKAKETVQNYYNDDSDAENSVEETELSDFIDT